MAKKLKTIKTIRKFIADKFIPPSIQTRGITLFEQRKLKMKEFDAEVGEVLFVLKAHHVLGSNHIIKISGFKKLIENTSARAVKLVSSCDCPNEWDGLCQHEYASLLALEEELIRFSKEGVAVKEYDQKRTLLQMRNIKEQEIKANVAKDDWHSARQMAFNNRAKIWMKAHQTVGASVSYKDETYHVEISKQGKDLYVTSCTCTSPKYRLCLHKAVTFLQLKFQKGANAFEGLHDWESYKDQLLNQYGFSLKDDLSGKFSFKQKDDEVDLVLLDKSLFKISELARIGEKYQAPKWEDKAFHIGDIDDKIKTAPSNLATPTGLAYVFYFRESYPFPPFKIVPVVGRLDVDTGNLKGQLQPLIVGESNIEIENLPPIDETDLAIVKIGRQLQWSELGNFLQQNSQIPVEYVWQNGGGYQIQIDKLKEGEKQELYGFVSQQLRQLFPLLKNKLNYRHSKEGKALALKNLSKINLSDEVLKLKFTLYSKGDFVILQASLLIAEEMIPLKDVKIYAGLMVEYKGNLHLVDFTQDMELIQIFLNQPKIKVVRQALPALLRNVVLPLQKRYEVKMEMDIEVVKKQISPTAHLYLKESGTYLGLLPVVSYGTQQVELDGAELLIFEEEGILYQVEREAEFEADFLRYLIDKHPQFADQFEQSGGSYFYLHYDEAISKMWLVNLFTDLKENNVEVYGFSQLTKFKYNVNPPEFQYNVSSGTDWFDVDTELKFGEQTVSLKEVQKALLRNDKYLLLDDGSIGILPEDWVKKYAMLFKMGEITEDSLRVSKIHFSLIDELYDQIDNSAVVADINRKKERLKNFKEIESVPLPSPLTATLRPYQEEGFNWIYFLDEFSWGGCLADDMGLGKTLQILTFLVSQKEKHGQRTNLVVVPTSLILNWEAEISKFCKGMEVYRHHGPDRKRNSLEIFEGIDVILTSYGVLTSDIELFSQFNFHYIILDESQSIKNPSTKRYKAVRLLKGNNRLILTGTPIENNTFDLYSQFNFLNPGMLGSMEFFKKEFATPIDKYGDEEKVKELRKLIYPFVLRRTKKMVATELPEKTETVLYCTMDSEQRGVYDAFKNEYRNKILQRIDEEGMGRSGMYILEGLMKLRQICDSPLLLNNPEDYGRASVKLEELKTHIAEKTGNHKILVFSQFLGMLQLLRDELESSKIDFEYLDGSCSPTKRQDSVNRFQEDPECRVFLISLKAGGVGLNLTAADYVFLVDPWWNPAVEQQAIDRTHRIGQTKKVFAYKMICTDTIEEKILNLQKKKLALAGDLISTEKSFLKQLDRQDVEFLFS